MLPPVESSILAGPAATGEVAMRILPGYREFMTVEDIKEVIVGLPEEDRHSLAAWIIDLDYDEWDKQMVRDFSPGGRGAAWASRVKQQIADGQSRPMQEGFDRLK
jgi:hypothetical protein